MRWMLVLAVALVCSTFVMLGAAEAAPFVFVSMPDTQRYAEDLKPPHPVAVDPQGTYRYFVDQTKWIAEHAQQKDIRCVIHLGDMVQTSSDIAQWERAKTAMDVIDKAGLPYGVCIGNHDLGKDRKAIFDTFFAYFGPERFTGRPWFGGASPAGSSTYLILPHEQYQFLFLNLCFATPKEDVAWANELLEQHRDKIVIVSTHGYLWDSAMAAGRFGEGVGTLLPTFAKLNQGSRIKDGLNSQQFYDEFVRKHPNILMVQCGHSGLDWYRTDGKNSVGLPVIEALTDYQMLPNGGEGYLRIYEIDPQAGTLTASTYSPTKDRYRTGFEHFLQLIALVFSLDEKVDKRSMNAEALKRIFVTTFKRDSIRGRDVVGEHPEYKQAREAYLQIFRECFMAGKPDEAGLPEDWEALWMAAFAPDPKNPDDYGPNGRSPSWQVKIDLDRYVAQQPAEAVGAGN
jgi:hypothetical protein